MAVTGVLRPGFVQMRVLDLKKQFPIIANRGPAPMRIEKGVEG